MVARKCVHVIDPWITCREQFDKPRVGHLPVGAILQIAKLCSINYFIGNLMWIVGRYYTLKPENVVELHPKQTNPRRVVAVQKQKLEILQQG